MADYQIVPLLYTGNEPDRRWDPIFISIYTSEYKGFFFSHKDCVMSRKASLWCKYLPQIHWRATLSSLTLLFVGSLCFCSNVDVGDFIMHWKQHLVCIKEIAIRFHFKQIRIMDKQLRSDCQKFLLFLSRQRGQNQKRISVWSKR